MCVLVHFGVTCAAEDESKQNVASQILQTQNSNMQLNRAASVHNSDPDEKPGVATPFALEKCKEASLRGPEPSTGVPARLPKIHKVPALTSSQMLAAKREQQRSMISCSMQVRSFHTLGCFLCVPYMSCAT
jgi:hypothetical protein